MAIRSFMASIVLPAAGSEGDGAVAGAPAAAGAAADEAGAAAAFTGAAVAVASAGAAAAAGLVVSSELRFWPPSLGDARMAFNVDAAALSSTFNERNCWYLLCGRAQVKKRCAVRKLRRKRGDGVRA